MANTLTATNSLGEQQPTTATNGTPLTAVVGTNEDSGLQQTRSSDALGVQSKSPSPTPDDNLMNFLESEAAGTVHETNTDKPRDYHTALMTGAGVLVVALMVFLLIAYKRLIHKILDPNYHK